MKNIVLIFMLFSTISTFSKECSCGSFEEGLVDFQVGGDEAGCCEGTATGSSSYLTNYEFSESGTWEVVSITRMTPNNAQKRCCNSV